MIKKGKYIKDSCKKWVKANLEAEKDFEKGNYQKFGSAEDLIKKLQV